MYEHEAKIAKSCLRRVNEIHPLLTETPLTMYVQHDARSYHEAQTSKYLCDIGVLAMISDSNRKLEDIATKIGWDWIDSECNFREIERLVQVLRKVVKC